MDAIIALISDLVRNNGAYAAEGHVLFDTQAFPDYGQLSGRNMDDMIAGARVEVAPYKRHPADFVLWKPSKPGEPVWDSPWGAGRSLATARTVPALAPATGHALGAMSVRALVRRSGNSGSGHVRRSRRIAASIR